ncbi:MAG: hypothetical protein QOC72_3937 [Methylobacteriaceae bacterium]|nr:hypothetical protein [Methylobacteriaceae bacterium]
MSLEICNQQTAWVTIVAQLYAERCEATGVLQVALAKQEAEWAGYDRAGRARSEREVDAAYEAVDQIDQRMLAAKIEHPSDLRVLAAVNADKRHWSGEFRDAFVIRLLEVISTLLPASPAIA